VAESGVPGYDIAVWAGLFAPAGTPPAVISRLYREASRVMGSQDTKDKLKNIGMDPGGLSPEQLTAMIKADIAKYAAIAKAPGIKQE
jgi:tripartite-type tricarboxylate transporter receptor subunit TctC